MNNLLTESWYGASKASVESDGQQY